MGDPDIDLITQKVVKLWEILLSLNARERVKPQLIEREDYEGHIAGS